ncbi:threonine aldolase family protein [Gemmiger sp.]|uniref:threonine aldolase family protein n=1 Tax=Gemmiger sp. TaxID=2049027 RepID=UPI003A8EC972
MLRFECDYGEGAAPAVLDLLQQTNFDQTPGYGEDEYCAKAAAQIRSLCDAPDADVHFFVGATQAKLTVIAAALKPWQGVLCADSGHIHVHETGAVEATGHKCLALPGKNGKITARQVRKAVKEHRANASHEHEVQPGMVYISNPTEVGTLYNKEELTELSAACYELGLYLFVDGARMAYGLTSPANDLSLQDYAALCDVFYLGGTKCGALFGEAVVITNDDLKPDFRYCIKQHGGMLAKGRLLGEQFLALLDGEDGGETSLYFTMARHANEQALHIRAAFEAKGCKVLHDSPTNQQFFALPDEWYAKLTERYAMTHMGKPDKHHTAVRICTSWATKDETVEQLIEDVNAL